MERKPDTLSGAVKIITGTFTSNLTAVFFYGGSFCLFLGAFFSTEIDQFITVGTGEFIYKAGGAVLGAGVFAVVMKSAQFTDLFQRHIFNVFYRPEEVVNRKLLLEKWKLITNSILRGVLPNSHSKAADKIEQQFFDGELEYHFEQYYNSYTISVDRKSNVATIDLFSESKVILSPHISAPVLDQNVETSGSFVLSNLRLNGDEISSEKYLKTVKDKHVLRVPLKKYAKTVENGDKIVHLEKVARFTQNLSEDPYIKAKISRYIKGARIRVKTPGDFKVFFEKFGLGDLPDNHYVKDDGEGYERWTLVEPNDLLLPGQGYILIIMPTV